MPLTATPPAAGELRRGLKQLLPDYMIPSAYMMLDAFPLTNHGKLDHEALAALEIAEPPAAAENVAPRTAAERAVASVWSEVLEIGPLGALDDFFERGGHSLLAAQAVAHLQSLLDVDIPLRLLFESPTVEGLARRIDELRAEGSRQRETPITPVPREGTLPLSCSQRALWFLDRLTPGSPLYNVHAAVRITGVLDRQALERGFQEIVRRHEAVRTSFPALDGLPVQRVSGGSEICLERIDLGSVPEHEREAEARRLALLERQTPFDLAAGPLVRAKLIRLGDRDHAVLLTMHHIVTDGWSMRVAAGELAALYDAYTRGDPSPLPEPTLQYADYAAWQNQRLQGARLEELLSFWRSDLEGLEPLRLPTDRPRPAVRTPRGGLRFFTLDRELSGSLRALARASGATLFMALLAAFQSLLARYSGQRDIAVGVPVANRNRPELEPMVGYFMNMIVLRTTLADNPTFRTLLSKVRAHAIRAFEHQELPFDRLVELLQPPRDPSRSPFFDVMFVLQNNRMPDVTRQDLTLAFLTDESGSGTAKFDLTLAAVDDDETISGSLEFNADLFDAATIERMLGHFQALIRGAVANPDQPILEVSLLDETEQVLVLSRWNETARALPVDGFAHRLFEVQARCSPDAVALRHEEVSLTYESLNVRANQIAHYLRSIGVGPEVRVGLQLERSPEMAAGLLGILKAGGAYVPLDPAEPAARRGVMLHEAGVRHVVTTRSLARALERPAGWSAWTPTDPRSRQPVHDLQLPGTPEHAAYILFTSGSTGTPRGVVVSHRSVVNHSLAAVRLFALEPGDRVLQFAPLQFDISVEEIFPTWTAGACLVLRDGDELLDPHRFARWTERQGITVLDLPTAFWHACVQRWSQTGEVSLGAVRLMVVGGEEALPEAYQQWRKLTGGRVRWLNTYGPTEATVAATAFEPPECGDGSCLAVLPIGRPLANCRAYVLDDRLHAVPIGLPGELYLGGAGVGRCYVNQPAATASRFIPDPFSGAPAHGSIARAIACAGGPTASLCSWGASMHRPRCAASGSSSVRWKRPCGNILRSVRPRSLPRAILTMEAAWMRFWSPEARAPSRTRRFSSS